MARGQCYGLYTGHHGRCLVAPTGPADEESFLRAIITMVASQLQHEDPTFSFTALQVEKDVRPETHVDPPNWGLLLHIALVKISGRWLRKSLQYTRLEAAQSHSPKRGVIDVYEACRQRSSALLAF